MSEVAFNEEVAAEVLNNIGVDLGLTEFSYFQDNMPYAVHQLNQITSDLVSSGVLRTGENGTLGCEVIASGGMAYVQAGIVVFASGAKIRITQPVGVDLVPGTVIYALNDTTTGTASLEVSETTPSGDYVLLAEVDSEGALLDRRSGCVAKVTMTADIQNVYREVTATLEDVYHSGGSYFNNEITVDVGTDAYSYIIVVEAIEEDEYVRTFVPHENNAFLSEEEIETSILCRRNNKYRYLKFTRNGQYQKISVQGSGGSYPDGTYTIKFMVM